MSNLLRRSFFAVLGLLCLLLCSTVTWSQLSGPGNDISSNAWLLDENPEYGSNVSATNDTGGTASVWYKWTAPQNGTFTINTDGTTGLNTALKVFSSSLVLLDSDEDGGTDGVDAKIFPDISVSSGNTYYIAVSSEGTATGAFRLNYGFTPSTTGGGGGCTSTTPNRGQALVQSPADDFRLYTTDTFPVIKGTALSSTCGKMTNVKVRLWRPAHETGNRYYNEYWFPGTSTTTGSWGDGDDTAARITVSVDDTGNWVWPSDRTLPTGTNIRVGSYNIDVSGYDGITVRISSNDFFVDAPEYSVTVASPAEGAVLTNGFSSVRGSFFSKGGKVTDIKVTLQNSSNQYWTLSGAWSSTKTYLSATKDDTSKSWSVSSSSLPPASQRNAVAYKITAYAFDSQNYLATAEKASDTNSFTVSDAVAAPTYNLAFSSPAASTVNTPLSSLTSASGTYTSTGDTISAVKLSILDVASAKYWTGTAWTTTKTPIVTSLTPSNGTWKYNTFPPAAGRIKTQYTLEATAFDSDGTARKVVSHTAFVSDPSVPVVVRPDNDPFATPDELPGTSGSISGTTVNATRETGESDLGNTALYGNSIWYLWHSPSDGTIDFDTFDSSIDTVLKVYTGSSLSTLTEIAINDDYTSSISQSKVTRSVFADTDYRIVVSGYNSVGGAVNLNWNFTPTAPPLSPAQPDLHIRVAGSSEVVGNNLFTYVAGQTPAPMDQQQRSITLSGGVAQYLITLENDGQTASAMRLRLQQSAGTFPTSAIHLYDGSTADAAKEITTAVSSDAGWLVPAIAPYTTSPRERRNFLLTVAIPASTPEGQSSVLSVFAKVGADLDRVAAATSVAASRPDTWVGLKDGTLKGDDLYYGQVKDNGQISGKSDQLAVKTVAPSERTFYQVDIQNDGEAIDTFTLRGWMVDSVGSDVWTFDDATVKYWLVNSDATWTNITTATKAGTQSLTSIAPGARRTVIVDVTAPATAPDGAMRRYLLKVYGGSNNTYDIATTETTIRRAWPDLKVGYTDENDSQWTGTGIFSGKSTTENPIAATDQMRESAVVAGTAAPGGVATYKVRLTNSGTYTENFILRGVDANTTVAGFEVSYWDGIKEITGEMLETSAGTDGVRGFLVTGLGKNLTRDIEVRVKALTSAPPNYYKNVFVYAFNKSDESLQDRALTRTWTSGATGFKPDTWVRREDETSSIGNNVFYTTDSSTQMSQGAVSPRATGVTATAVNRVSYIATIQNDGSVADRFTLLGFDSSGYPITLNDARFFDVVGKTEISAAVKAGNYITPSIAAGAQREVRIEVTAPEGATAGQIGFISLYATSVANPQVRDRATTKTIMLASPTNLYAIASGSGKITLYWDKVEGAVGYYLYRSTTAGDQNYATPIDMGSSAQISYSGGNIYMFTQDGLANGTEYFYTVKAVAPGGTSNASNEDSDIVDPGAIPWHSRDPGQILTVAFDIASASTDYERPEATDAFVIMGPDGAIYEKGVASQQPPVGTVSPDGQSFNLNNGDSVVLPSLEEEETTGNQPRDIGGKLKGGPYRGAYTIGGYSESAFDVHLGNVKITGNNVTEDGVTKSVSETGYVIMGSRTIEGSAAVDAAIGNGNFRRDGKWHPFIRVFPEGLQYPDRRRGVRAFYGANISFNSQTDVRMHYWVDFNKTSGKTKKVPGYLRIRDINNPSIKPVLIGFPLSNHYKRSSIGMKRAQQLAQTPENFGQRFYHRTGSYMEDFIWSNGRLKGANDTQLRPWVTSDLKTRLRYGNPCSVPSDVVTATAIVTPSWENDVNIRLPYP